MRVFENTPEKNPSAFFMPRDTGETTPVYDDAGVEIGIEPIIAYDLDHVEIDNGDNKILRRKSLNGYADIAITANTIDLYENDVLEVSSKLRAEIFAGGQWRGQDFSFVGANIARPEPKTIRAWVSKNIPALGLIGVLFGIEAVWTRQEKGLTFYVDPVTDQYPVRLLWTTTVADGNTSLMFSHADYTGNKAVDLVDNLNGTHDMIVTFEPAGYTCDPADGRTALQRYTDSAGLKV